MFIVRNGRRIPYLFDADPGGGGGDPTPTPPATPPAAPTPPAPTPPASPTDAQLAAERAAATQAQTEAIATQLGVPVEEAVKIVAQHRAAEEASKSETQRAQEAAAAAQAEAERVRNEAVVALRDVHKRAALVSAGIVDATQQNDLMLLVQIPEGTADADLPTVALAKVEELRQRYPAMFGSATPGRTPPPSTTPGVPPTPPAPGGPAGTSLFDRGAERAKAEAARNPARHPNPFDSANEPRRDAPNV